MGRRKSGDRDADRGTHEGAPRASAGGKLAGGADREVQPAPAKGGSRAAPVPVDDDARLDGLLPLGISPLTQKGAGRPKGARNKRSETMADYIVRRYGDPLEASASIAALSPRELIQELRAIASDCGTKLGASVMEIIRWQQDIRRDVLPYVHAKRAPVGADGETVEPPTFHFHGWQGPTAGHPEGAKPRSVEDIVDVTPNPRHEENQGVSDDESSGSHGARSHDRTSD